MGAEFFFLPYWMGLPRDMFLMGFAAKPESLIDDTPINAMGFTGDPINLAKSPATIRILTLGGSAMFNRRMAERLREGLTKVSRRPIEVLGAALRTHTTKASVIKYKILRKYSFDFVLIYHGINDLWTNHVPIEDFRLDYSHLGPWYTRSLWLDHCLICRITYNQLFYRRPASYWVRENLANFASEQTFHQNIAVLINAIRQDGSTPILMTFAWSVPSHYSYEAFQSHTVGYNNPTDYDSWPVENWGSPEYVREGLRKHNNHLHQLARIYNVLLIDQERLMGKDLKWFGDVCHFSEEGTDRFIENISEFFIQKNLFHLETQAIK
jgi:hypothetical protein